MLSKYNKNIKGDVFDIQRFAVHDGPGIRTLVFLKGCHLKCLWCQNPEGQTQKALLIYSEAKCILCGRCINNCPEKAISFIDGKLKTDFKKCKGCGQCVQICPQGARKIDSKVMSAEEVVEEIKKDEVYYRRGGGVTLSGGDPLFQSEFSTSILGLCKQNYINTAIETSGFTDENTMKRIAEVTDLFLFDLKHMNSQKHKKYTGVPNETILNNAKIISKMNKNIIIRIPLIPSINDSIDNIRKTVDFVKNELNNVKIIEILPYHELGLGKYKSLGINYSLENIKPPKKKKVYEIINYIKSFNIDAIMGGFLQDSQDG